MYSQVGLSDYEGYGLGGFNGGVGAGGVGGVSPQELENIAKALQSGYQNPRMFGANALMAQSLEATLRYLTFTTEHIQLWRDAPKTPAMSTSVEYTVTNNYGSDVGGFVAGGDPGQVIDGNYERRITQIKFMALQGEVAHPDLLTKPAHGDVMAIKTREVTTKLLQLVEQALFFARSDTVPLSFDGFDRLLRKDATLGDGYNPLTGGINANTPNIIDVRGGALTMEAIEQGQNTIVEATGRGSVLYMANKALSSITTQFFAKERIALPNSGGNGIAVGTPVKQYNSTGGPIDLKTNYFLRSGKVNGVKKAPASATSPRAATAPTIALATSTPGTPPGPSQFSTADVVGASFNYQVSAVNSWGESGASAASAVTIAAAGDIATITITDGGGSFPATGYNIYRVVKGGDGATTTQFCFSVPRNAATTVAVDSNRYIPGTSRAYLFQMNTEAVNIYQLAPLMKIPMATTALSVRFAECIYLAPVLYSAGRLVIFDNVLDD